MLYLRQAGVKASGARRQPRGGGAASSRRWARSAALARGPAEDVEQAIDLRLELRPPLLQLGQLERVLALSQRGREDGGAELGDEQRLARVYTYLINYHYLKGEPDLAIELRRALPRASARPSGRGAAGARPRLHGLQLSRPGPLSARRRRSCKQNVDALEARGAGRAAARRPGSPTSRSSGWLALHPRRARRLRRRARLRRPRAARRRRQRAMPTAQTIARTLAGLVWLRRGHLERALLSARARASTPAARSTSTCGGRSRPRCSGSPASTLGRVDEGLAPARGRRGAHRGAGRQGLPRALDRASRRGTPRRGPDRAARAPRRSARSTSRSPTRSAAIRPGRSPARRDRRSRKRADLVRAERPTRRPSPSPTSSACARCWREWS